MAFDQIMWSEEIAGFMLIGNDGSLQWVVHICQIHLNLREIYENPELLDFSVE